MIELINVCQTYNPNTIVEVKALDNISLRIDDGEFIGLIGHTGSGKSTLVQHLNGLIKPTSGKILYNGVDIHQKGYKKSELRSKVGLVFQYPEYQIFEDTIYKEVAFGPKNLGCEDKEIDERVKSSLKIVGIDESYYDKSPFFLSGGQKRRIAIASVLAMKPDILILDEPAAGLDPRGRKFILDGIDKLNKTLGISIIMVSHSMEDIANYADRIIVMNEGKLIYNDTPEKIFSHQKELLDMNLDVPVTAKILHKLKLAGLDVDDSIFNIEDTKKEIIRALKND